MVHRTQLRSDGTSSGVTTGAGLPDVERIVRCLDQHGVLYLVVGGIGARLYGAQRRTFDFDSLPKTSKENLGRLAAAMRELTAHLRVGGLSDQEAKALPTQIDADFLGRMDISTWRTDAGDLDVLTASQLGTAAEPATRTLLSERPTSPWRV